MVIYKITNTKNNKVYIGQTIQPFKDRMNDHKNSIKAKRQRNVPFVNAIRKYGWENFKCEIIEECNSIEELNEREIYWIKHFNSLVDDGGYNLKLGGANHGSHSEYTKKKMSLAQTGEKNHAYGKKGKLSATSKRVIDMETNIIYDNATQFAEKFKLSVSKVCAVCRGTRGSTGGRVIRYVDENNNPIIPEKVRGRRYNNLIRNNDTGEVFKSLVAVGKAYGINHGNLGTKLRANGGKAEYHGYNFELLGKVLE